MRRRINPKCRFDSCCWHTQSSVYTSHSLVYNSSIELDRKDLDMSGESHPALEIPYSHLFKCKSCFWTGAIQVDLARLPESFRDVLKEANILHLRASPKCDVVFSRDWEQRSLRLMGFCEKHDPPYNFDLPFYPMVRISLIDAYSSIVKHHAALCDEPLDFVIH